MDVRTILHVDLDAFFASVEQRDDPSLRGKPVVVGGSARRGVVAAASYEARVFGVHSAMPMAEALRLCPQAMVIPHHFERYREASEGFFAILSSYSPLVESLSLDEAFVDVTGSRGLFGDGPTIARRIKERVRSELDLVASVGVAASKFIAKIASDIDKPDGLRVVEAGGEHAFLHPLPLSRLWGVGKVTRERLHALGLQTIGDVARYPESALRGRLGERLGTHLSRLANAVDDRDVVTDHAPVTIGHEETFEDDIGDPAALRPILIHQADRVASRLRRAGLRAGSVTLKIRYADFRAITRQRALDSASCDGVILGRTACELLSRVAISADGGKATRVRLCGVSVSQLEDEGAPRQLTFDQGHRDRGERLGRALDAIADRFGDDKIRRG